MKETEFIDQNKEKWSDLETELQRDGEVRPDRITHLYIDSVDDLSFARTHYPNRMVRAYLNGVVEVLSLKVQRSQRNFWKNIKLFWKQDLPLAMFEARREFLISFLILAVAIGIGIFSSMHDPTFARYILGDSYIEITLANIEKGDPLAIYKDPAMGTMFFQITLNNILVSARTFLLSLFLGFGTVLIIIYNGIMLGVFQYFFIERGLFFESFLTIWQHGVIEISCIVLAGCAGLVLARGILFPRSYSRLDSFRINGRKSLMIMLGLMPLLVLSGAIESYVTRFTDAHWTVRLMSILASLSFVLFYFVWYPRRVANGVDADGPEYLATQPMVTSGFTTKSIQTNVSVFWESIRVLLGPGSWFGRTLLAVCALVGGLGWWFGFDSDGSLNTLLSETSVSLWYLNTDTNVLLIGCNFLVAFSALVFAHRALYRHLGKQEGEVLKPFGRSAILVSLVLALMITASLVNFYAAIALVVGFPLIGLLMVSVFHASESETGVWDLTRQLIGRSFGRLLILLSFYGFSWLLIAIVSQDMLGQIMTVFLAYFVMPDHSDFIGNYVIPGLFTTATLFSFTALVYISFHLSFFSLSEIRTARLLAKRINEEFPTQEDDRPVKVSLLRKDVIAS